MNRRGFLSSIGAGLIAAAATTRLASSSLKVVEVEDDGVALSSSSQPLMDGDFEISNLRVGKGELTEASIEEMFIEIEKWSEGRKVRIIPTHFKHTTIGVRFIENPDKSFRMEHFQEQV